VVPSYDIIYEGSAPPQALIWSPRKHSGLKMTAALS
jgi:hypothetical protein